MSQLSNTATPYYYGKFRDAVLRGVIPVNKEVAMEMNRIDKLIANPTVYYSRDKVEGWIQFCENELVLNDGSQFHMLDSFKVWGEQVFGWYYYVKRSIWEPDTENGGGHYITKHVRKMFTNKQFLIVGRGNAKTFYDESIQAYFLVVDQHTTHQIVTAPTMKQAELTLAPFKTAITRSPGPLFQFLTEGSLQNTTGSKADRVKLASTKLGIQQFITSSLLEVIPMTIDKLQGYQPRVTTVDEWLSGDIREDIIGAVEQGASKNEDWLIIATSSEGTVRNGPGDDIKLELMRILKGEYKAPHTSIWWYKLDDIKEVAKPSMWVKAMPNIGLTVSYETIQQEVERAEKIPSTRNDTLAKRFGIPTEGYTLYFTYQETLPHRHKEFWEMGCSMGCDLSRGDDFCAFTFLFPLPTGEFGVKCRCYISEMTLRRLPASMRIKYDEFMKEGTLMVLEGNVLDMMQVYDDLEEFIQENKYNVISVGYDPYNAIAFIERWCKENGDYGVVKVPQGVKTESVPLGELKNLAAERMLLFDEAIMTFCMGNSIVIEDTNGNRKILKLRYDKKIDAVAAMMDAFVAYKTCIEDFE